MSTEKAWGDLRSLRATPPGLTTSDPQRLAVFASAMEQCEQLLRGAAGLGYPSRPLNLFYALSQAGRAITAAWSPPGFSEPPQDLAWQLSGHGIRAFKSGFNDPLDQICLADADKPLPEKSKKRLPSFPAVARVLGSDSLLRPVHFVDLWAALPEAIGRPAPGDNARWGPIQIPWTEDPSGREMVTRAVQAWTHNWPNQQLQQWTRAEPSELNLNVAMAIATRYPTINSPITLDVPWQTNWFGSYRGSVLLTWGLLHESDVFDRGWFVDSMTEPYRDDRWAFPLVGGQKLHPLVIWWAVLFTLSMLARYEPQAWARAIDVDASPWAVPLEHLLDQAVEALPEVIFQALEQTPLVDHEYPLPGGIISYG